MALDVGKVRVGVALSDPLGYNGAAFADVMAQEPRRGSAQRAAANSQA
jgi:RNase H-fold protein (predicted Holliday junction resolvase)